MINPIQPSASAETNQNSGQNVCQEFGPIQSPQLHMNRRNFVTGVAAVSIAASARSAAPASLASKRILVGSGTPNGILSFAWDSAKGTLKPEGVAAVISHSTWLHVSPDRRYLYVACELEEFQGKPTGAVASFSLNNGKLKAISAVSSTGKGTCHLTTDHTGHVVIAANYTGGSAASFLSDQGKLSNAVWSEHYKGYQNNGNPTHGPVPDRQEAAHAHFASLSPDNRFVYINDLGADKIHIYTLDPRSGKLATAGNFDSKPGNGPRTLHFLMENGVQKIKVAYCVNELASTVDVLRWNPTDGSLHLIQTADLLPPGTTGLSRACDTVITRDGKFVYFAQRDHDFLMGFRTDHITGKIFPLSTTPRTNCGGKIPRNFTLDPTERWMLVANQDSSNISVFARNPTTGELSNEAKTFAADTPMCIVFV